MSESVLPFEEYTLPARLDALAADSVFHDLETHIQGGVNLHLKASEVTRLDTPAVQLLLAIAKTQKNLGVQLVVEEPSTAMAETMGRLGLSQYLQEWKG